MGTDRAETVRKFEEEKKPIPSISEDQGWYCYIITWADGGPRTFIRARTDGEALSIANKFAASGGFRVQDVKRA